MIDPSNITEVDPAELLARFIFSKQHIRRSNNTIKPGAFMPDKNGEISVTRHRDATSNEVWCTGNAVAAFREKSLIGRGDTLGTTYVKQRLKLEAAPILDDPKLPDNPNHANVTGWPKDDKEQQKLLALEVAMQTELIIAPLKQ